MPTDPAIKLATWLRANTPQSPDEMTHLKVQKLMFYGYGAAVAHGLDRELRGLSFEPWKHGPVNRAVWAELKSYGGSPLPVPACGTASFSAGLEQLLRWVINIYGRMTAWDLRQETHTEQPWIDAFHKRLDEIPDRSIREHFEGKFSGPVRYPEFLVRRSNVEIDGLPMTTFPSLKAMSLSVTALFGGV